MRIRSIRPEYWSSEDIAALPWDVRLVFIGLWSYVDDNGVGRDNEKLIVADLFPLEEDPRETLGRVSGALSTLSDRGLVTRYEVDGRRYLFIATWDKHQRVEKPGKTRYPRPTSGSVDSPEAPPTVSGESPETLPPGEGEKGRRGEGEKGERTAPIPRTRGTRIPDDFAPTADDRSKAKQLGFTDRDLDTITVSFIDYWRGAPGQKGVKLDWDATWRNWVRKDAADRAPRRPALQAVGGTGYSNKTLKPWEL
jgi:hypothetical protein